MIDWRLFALASAFFAALTAIFGKIGVSEMNSNLATFIRTVVILFVAALLLTLRGEWQKPDLMSQKSILFLVLSGVATGASWLCYYHALKLAPASKVAPIDKVSVVFVILMSAIFLNEPLSLKVLAGGVLILSGALVLAF